MTRTRRGDTEPGRDAVGGASNSADDPALLGYIRTIGARMRRFGGAFQALARIEVDNPLTLSAARKDFSKILRRSLDHPQVVCVQGRNQQPTETYLVMPARALAELIETIERQVDDGMPITDYLAQVGDGRALPMVSIQPHGGPVEDLPRLRLPVTTCRRTWSHDGMAQRPV